MNDVAAEPTEIDAGSRRTSAALLLVAILLHAVIALGYAHETPVFEGPDESDHFTYASHLAQTGSLPRMRGHGERTGASVFVEESLAHHPPVYYGLLAATLWATGGRGLVASKQQNPERHRDGARSRHMVWLHGYDEGVFVSTEVQQFRWLRHWSVLFGALSLWWTWRIGRSLWPRRPRAAGIAVLLLAAMPMWSFLHGVLNNDGLAIMLSHAALFRLVQASIERRLPPARALLLGVLIALAVCTKLTTVFLIPLFLLVLLSAMVGRFDSMARLTLAGLLGVLPVVFGFGAFAWHNHSLYGDALAKKAHDAVFAAARVPDGQALEWLWSGFVPGMARSFVGSFGWLTLDLPLWMRWGAGLVLAAAGIGLLLGRLRPRHAMPGRSLAVAILVLSIVAVGGFAVLYNLEFRQPQGRFLFPAAGPMFLCLGLGLCNLVQRTPASIRRLGLLLIAVPVALSAWTLHYWFAWHFDVDDIASGPHRAILSDVGIDRPASGIALMEPADGTDVASPPLLVWQLVAGTQQRPLTVHVVDSTGKVLVASHEMTGVAVQGTSAPFPASVFAMLPRGRELRWSVRGVADRQRGELSAKMPRSNTFGFTIR